MSTEMKALIDRAGFVAMANGSALAGDAEALRNMGHLGQAMAWLGQAVAGSATPYPVRRSGEA